MSGLARYWSRGVGWLAVLLMASACRASLPETGGSDLETPLTTFTALAPPRATKPQTVATATALAETPQPRSTKPQTIATATEGEAAAVAASPATSTARPTPLPAISGFSLRFFGTGRQDIDRVKLRLDPPVPADIGATDFTIEFWVKAEPGSNPAPAVACGANNVWINGNVVVDRDRFNQDRKFGLSLAGGVVVFGVTGPGTGEATLCGNSDLRDGAWHHVAVQRRRADGYLWLYVDGRLEAEVDGPEGDISYPDGAAPGRPGAPWCSGPGGGWGGACVNDPYLVIGAEKHDADQDGGTLTNPLYPAFAGWVDELRLSGTLRYAAEFDPPGSAFAPDADTLALFHFDEGPVGTCTQQVLDSANAAGGPTPGECRNGGPEMPGPEYSIDTPFGAREP